MNFLKKFMTFVFGSILVELFMFGVKNKADGKTVLGRKMPMKQKTYTTWQDEVVLGSEDGKVE